MDGGPAEVRDEMLVMDMVENAILQGEVFSFIDMANKIIDIPREVREDVEEADVMVQVCLREEKKTMARWKLQKFPDVRGPHQTSGWGGDGAC